MLVHEMMSQRLNFTRFILSGTTIRTCLDVDIFYKSLSEVPLDASHVGSLFDGNLSGMFISNFLQISTVTANSRHIYIYIYIYIRQKECSHSWPIVSRDNECIDIYIYIYIYIGTNALSPNLRLRSYFRVFK